MNFHWPFLPKPAPVVVTRYFAATRAESEAARRQRTETHLLLAVENAVLHPPRLLTPKERLGNEGVGK
jgi:hypothetical protein